MRLIGLCGRSGSGKSAFCRIASQNGIITIDCDAVYREMVSAPSPCLAELEEAFGAEIINNSALDRKKLAKIVFSDRQKLELLNSISHKHVRLKIADMLSTYNDDDIVVLDAPTLFESGIDGICDLVIAVIVSDEIVIPRIIERDGITESEAVARLSNQYSAEFLTENSDCIIYNDSSPADFETAVNDIIAMIKRGMI